MDLFEAIRNRRATRAFTAEPVGRDVLRRLVDAAVQAPSAMNLQPWAFAVVTDPVLLRRVAEQAKKHLLHGLAPASPLARYAEMLGDPGFDIFYGAPALVVVYADRGKASEASNPAEDCCLAAQNLMLAAHGLGLGTCWIGFARPWLDLPAGKAALGVAESLSAVAPIVVGHPREHPERTSRNPPQIAWSEPSG